MFNTLKNLTKAAVAVVVAPVDVVVDLATAIPRAQDSPEENLFAGTEKRLKQAGKALDEALKPGGEFEEPANE